MLSLVYVALVNFYIIFNSDNCDNFLFLEGENDTYGYLHINNTRLELMEGGPYGREIYTANISSSFLFNWAERTVNESKMELVFNQGNYHRVDGVANISFLCGFNGLYQSNKSAITSEKGNHSLNLLYILLVFPLLSPLVVKPEFRRLFYKPVSQETQV